MKGAAMRGENMLAASGKPLFFPVGNLPGLGLPPPEIRRGDAVRLWARSLTVVQKEAVVVSAKTGRAWRLASDEGAYLNGFDEAPCPLSFMTVGMVSSIMNEAVALAKKRDDIDPMEIRLTLDNFYTMKGSALKGTMTGGALRPKLRVELSPRDRLLPAIQRGDPPTPMCKTTADMGQVLSLVRKAAESAPVNGLLRGENRGLFSLSRNGAELRPEKVDALDFRLPDNTARIGDAVPDSGAPGAPIPVVSKIGMTEKTDEDTSSRGSSLKAEQDRQLHVQGICTLMDDKGMKRIEQRLFNPRGSVFQFVSDEAPENGGGGRAPDAQSHIAAGLGFCFMTQFGRHAKIVRKELSQYDIAQDLHFSATGGAGMADPAETHVYLQTGEDDDFARTALDAGERTCFLHALCRTDLRMDVEPGGRA